MRIQPEIDKIGASLCNKSVSNIPPVMFPVFGTEDEVFFGAVCINFSKMLVQRRAIDDFTSNCLYFGVRLSAWWLDLDNSENENISKVAFVYN